MCRSCPSCAEIKAAVARVKRTVGPAHRKKRVSGHGDIERIARLLQGARLDIIEGSGFPDPLACRGIGPVRLNRLGRGGLEERSLPPISGRRGIGEVFRRRVLVAFGHFHGAGHVVDAAKHAYSFRVGSPCHLPQFRQDRGNRYRGKLDTNRHNVGAGLF